MHGVGKKRQILNSCFVGRIRNDSLSFHAAISLIPAIITLINERIRKSQEGLAKQPHDSFFLTLCVHPRDKKRKIELSLVT